jgi:hypothetical protein
VREPAAQSSASAPESRQDAALRLDSSRKLEEPEPEPELISKLCLWERKRSTWRRDGGLVQMAVGREAVIQEEQRPSPLCLLSPDQRRPSLSPTLVTGARQLRPSRTSPAMAFPAVTSYASPSSSFYSLAVSPTDTAIALGSFSLDPHTPNSLALLSTPSAPPSSSASPTRLSLLASVNVPYPVTSIAWDPTGAREGRDVLGTTGDALRVYKVRDGRLGEVACLAHVRPSSGWASFVTCGTDRRRKSGATWTARML